MTLLRILLLWSIILSSTILTAQESNTKVQDSIPQKTIYGTLTDDAGNPLPGILLSLKNKGLIQGTYTDIDGRFMLIAKTGDTLVLHDLGYEQKEYIISKERVYDLILEAPIFMEESLELREDIESSNAIQDAAQQTEAAAQQILEAQQAQEEKAIIDSDLEAPSNTYIPSLNVKRLQSTYAYDSRFEKTQLDASEDWQAAILKNTASIALLIEKEKLYALSEDYYQLDTSNTLGAVYNLCVEQAFYSQPIVGTGTGFIVGPNTMMTANHVFERAITNYRVVFGFEVIDKNGTIQHRVKASDVYYPQTIQTQLETLDVVAFTVDRSFDRPALDWEASKDLSKNNEIYMIGYPSGLPLKIALNADIVDNSTFQYFYTSLDGFQGNSGSPVFNLVTNKVIGVLVSGELDYEYNGTCYTTTLCKYPYCKGEKVIRIERIMQQIDGP